MIVTEYGEPDQVLNNSLSEGIETFEGELLKHCGYALKSFHRFINDDR